MADIILDIERIKMKLNNIQNIELGTGDYIFDYTNLSIDELYYLLHPSSKTQVPKLMEAIRSLKMSKLDTNSELASYYKQDLQGNSIVGNIYKSKKAKRPFEVFYYNHIVDIEDKSCNFDFNLLAAQITNECIWDSDRNNSSLWGDRNDTDVSNCINLISRINNVMSTSEYNKISLSFLPILGEGEALLVGVDFPMPLTIKIDVPKRAPDSQTPKLKQKDKLI